MEDVDSRGSQTGKGAALLGDFAFQSRAVTRPFCRFKSCPRRLLVILLYSKV